MQTKTFSNGLVIKHRKSAIVFEHKDGIPEKAPAGARRGMTPKKPGDFEFSFTPEEFQEFADYMMQAANEAWSSVTPKEANSFGADYWEYYDKQYDNNGYLSLSKNGISVSAPHLSKDTLYQFNKAKVQAFLYDLFEQLELNQAGADGESP